MNKIEHELKWSIESNYLDGFFFNGEDECIRELDVDAATKKCFESIERHCKAFAEWLNINEYMLIDNIWFNLGHVTILTTEQLFKLYIEQL